jgi:ferredoxin
MSKGKDWTKEEVREYGEGFSAIVVPINVTIKGKQRILDTTQVENLLRKARKIVISNCECRTRVRGCDAPLDVCLFLDAAAEERISEGLGREVTLSEALANLRRTNEAGLVQIAVANGKTPVYICSCCPCCCYSIASMKRFGFNDSLMSSDMIAIQHDDSCNDCGLCAERCHFDARTMSNGTLLFKPEKCFGCGLCLSSCQSNAISMGMRNKK